MAGLVEPDRGERIVRQGTTVRYLPQEPDLSGFATVARLCRGGARAGRRSASRDESCSSALGLHRRRGAGAALRRRGAARGAGPRAGAEARHPDPRRADQPPRPAGDRMAGGGAVAHAARRSCWSATTGGCCRRCRAPRCGSTAARSAGSTAALTPSRHGATRRSSRRSATAKSSTARSRRSSHWLRYGVTARRSRNQGRLRALNEMRRERREQLRVTGKVKFTVSDAKTSGKLVIEAKDVSKAFGERDAHPRFLHPHRARRPARHRRAERRGQDDAARHPDRRGRARQRHACGSAAISRSPRSTSAAPASIRRRR